MGTFDVTVLSIEDSIFEVRATGGNSHLGGSCFDNALVEHFAAEFKRKHKKDLTDSPRALGRLKAAAERAKRALSTAAQTSVECEALYEGIDFMTSITRARFEELNMKFFREVMDTVEKVLRDSKLDKSSIDQIVLVGGSCRIPKIQSMVQEFFNGKELNKSVSFDEGVAVGAGVQSHILTGGKDDEAVKDLLLLDVTPLDLGIETAGGIFTPLINRNTTIPVSKTQTFSTAQDGQSVVLCKVYEGQRKFTKDNTLLGTFELSGIPAKRRGEPIIEITYSVSAEGILEVSAVEKSSGTSKKIVINSDKHRLSREQIEKSIKEAEEFAEQDKRMAERVEAKNSFENMVYSLKTSIVDSGKASEEDTKAAKDALDKAQQWLDDHPSATKEEYDEGMRKLQAITTPILTKMYEQSGTGTVETQKGPENDTTSEGVKIDDLD